VGRHSRGRGLPSWSAPRPRAEPTSWRLWDHESESAPLLCTAARPPLLPLARTQRRRVSDRTARGVARFLRLKLFAYPICSFACSSLRHANCLLRTARARGVEGATSSSKGTGRGEKSRIGRRGGTRELSPARQSRRARLCRALKPADRADVLWARVCCGLPDTPYHAPGMVPGGGARCGMLQHCVVL